MENFKGTPGPWFINGSDLLHKTGHASEVICTFDIADGFYTVSDRDTLESMANINLIASAPELLEALQAIIDIADPRSQKQENIVIQAENAIKKALNLQS